MSKTQAKTHAKGIKLSEEKKKTKVEKRLMHKDLSEGQMQKLVEYRRNYYLTHNKWLLNCFVDTLKILGQLNLFHGLFIEI